MGQQSTSRQRQRSLRQTLRKLPMVEENLRLAAALRARPHVWRGRFYTALLGIAVGEAATVLLQHLHLWPGR